METAFFPPWKFFSKRKIGVQFEAKTALRKIDVVIYYRETEVELEMKIQTQIQI